MTMPVVFRTYRDGEVIALFPTIPGDYSGNVTSYLHVGQHGAAHYAYVVSITRPSTPDEIAPLLSELVSIGYDDLRVYTRRPVLRHSSSDTPTLWNDDDETAPDDALDRAEQARIDAKMGW